MSQMCPQADLAVVYTVRVLAGFGARARAARSNHAGRARRIFPFSSHLATIYLAGRGFSPAFVMTPAASAEDRKRSSATAESGCCEFVGSAPT